MAAALGKHLLSNSLLVFAVFSIVTAKKCPQLPPGGKDPAHVKSVNSRVNKLADDTEFQFKDSEVKYLYKVNLCEGEDSVAVRQVDKQHPDNPHEYIIGLYTGATIVGGSSWLMITYYGEKYNSHCGYSKKRSIFFIECDQSADNHAARMPTIVTEYAPATNNNTFCYYLFEMKHNAACPPSTTKISPGSVFIIIIVIITVLYLLLGFLYQRFLVGAKGLEQIPNYLLWREFGTLQADGCNYMCRCKTAGEPTRYKPMDDAIADDDTDGERDDTLLPV